MEVFRRRGWGWFWGGGELLRVIERGGYMGIERYRGVYRGVYRGDRGVWVGILGV